MTREYRRCPSCGERRHDLMFPWADPDGDLRPRNSSADTPRALKAQAVRAIEYLKRRVAAQQKGRNYSACLPCLNGDA